ncbi:DNA-binding response regulator, NarL/FixJ family, contains REC and HTH domains [Amycolatopsis tolypomycina]|uniref:DNA-binding response regulator, NarL/FixJ family, contains REC and HTH domains n=1 Tax=Amycolatopsis tolypomycina TaxID=208445 RepID=A0A1H4XQH7_9PSEU|nr:response regulator transcription factor [Amycolatopsis tolypomycina]SED07896.1 DNA-binding response regulator, NarL/FixJ family, contains REC and HTH domains [Amycolatopsis tolypomycina]
MISVLVADDEPLVRSGIRGLLETAEDIEVVAEAGSGTEALLLTRRHRPDVVLLDIHMAGGDGLSAAELVCRHVPSTAVAMLTTFGNARYVHRALRSGAVGFLLKDMPPRALLEAVRALAAGGAFLAPQVTRSLLKTFTEHDPERAGRARARLAVLSARERHVLTMLANGLSNAEIARSSEMSEGSVKAHVSRMLVKLGCGNRVQLAMIAYDAHECGSRLSSTPDSRTT